MIARSPLSVLHEPDGKVSAKVWVRRFRCGSIISVYKRERDRLRRLRGAEGLSAFVSEARVPAKRNKIKA